MRFVIRNIGGIDYKIRENGQVFSTFNKDRKKPIKQHITKDGYAQIRLGSTKDERVGKKSYLVHRVVATYFLRNPLNKAEVDHKDCNKTNNHVSNLRWVTREENMKSSYARGTHNRKGENHPLAILCENDVLEIRRLHDNNIMTIPKIAKKYGVSRYTVWDVVRRRSWTHI